MDLNKCIIKTCFCHYGTYSIVIALIILCALPIYFQHYTATPLQIHLPLQETSWEHPCWEDHLEKETQSVFLLGKFINKGAWWAACSPWAHESQTGLSDLNNHHHLQSLLQPVMLFCFQSFVLARCLVVGIIQHGIFRSASFTWKYTFKTCKLRFCLVLNNIPLSGYPHPLKDIHPPQTIQHSSRGLRLWRELVEMAESVAPSWWEQEAVCWEHSWEAEHRSPSCVCFSRLDTSSLRKVSYSGVVMV